MLNYTLKIADLRKETSDAITIGFKKPGLKQIRYKAGQYITLMFRINGRRYIRPYSFSSAPGVDGNLEITVKRVPGGVVSNHIFDKVNVGDLVEVIEPMGDFVLPDYFVNNEGQGRVMLWGVGSGITPLFSILKYVLHNLKSQVVLAYGNRNHESVIFAQQLTALQNAYPDRFFIQHFHTRPVIVNNDPYIVEGRIQPAKVFSIMNDAGAFHHDIHYICGPPGLKQSVKTALADLGTPPEKIFSEDFELVKDEREFTDIVTRTINITYAGQTSAVEVVKGKSILEAALDASIELPYSCQTGNCSVCKGELISGSIKQIGLEKKHNDLQPNEYLLCCAYPLIDNIEIKVQ